MKPIYSKILSALLFALCANVVSAQQNAMYVIDRTDCKKVQFYDSLYFNATNYNWDFGDGNTSTQTNPSHTYSSNGTYVVVFTANDSGFVNSIVDSFSLTINCGPCTNFKASAWSYKDQNNCKKINFVNNSPTANTYSWTFGDGNSSSLRSPSNTYAIDGNYTTTLIINDSLCSDTLTMAVNVNCTVNPCDSFFAAAGFTIDSSDCKKVYFTNYSSPGSYTWNFDDGNTSSATNPTHTYASKGSYRVLLDVSDSLCNDTTTLYVNIKCTPVDPCAGFKAKIVLAIDSLNNSNAILYNRSTGNVNSHFWDFGDGTTSTAAAPTHTYTTAGRITLTYIAQDTVIPCADTTSITFTVDSLGNIRRGDIKVVINVIDQTQNANSVNGLKEASTFNVYPNPSHEQFTINSDSKTQVFIYNTQGKLVHELYLESKEEKSINCSTWSRGMYYLVTKSNAVHKIILE